MKKSEIKIIQRHLTDSHIFSGEINGKLDQETTNAVHAALAQDSSLLPDDWHGWSNKRKAVAYLQILCHSKEIDSGKVDGFYGPQTETAAERLKILIRTGLMMKLRMI